MMNQQSLMGFNVFITPDVPKHQLAHGDYITPEYRAEINAWLIDLLGTTNIIEDDVYLVAEEKRQIFVNPRMFARLKNAVVESLK